jgi:hypothetical protein
MAVLFTLFQYGIFLCRFANIFSSQISKQGMLER